MAKLTCVPDASILVNNIYEIKQWVYSGCVHLYIPLSTSAKIEQLCNASLAASEVKREHSPKRPASKATSRKEFPLFDINPRVSREFLARAQSCGNDEGITFQAEKETFSQWKEAEKPVPKPKATELKPTTFASALLSKLNMGQEADGMVDEAKNAKPRLVARASDGPKSPWKMKKVPMVSAVDVPEYVKPLLSCMLWRLHEYDDDPLRPENAVLFTEHGETTTIAERLEIRTMTLNAIRNSVAEGKAADKIRDALTELDQDFPSNHKNGIANDDSEDLERAGNPLSPTANPFGIAKTVDEDVEDREPIPETKERLESEKVQVPDFENVKGAEQVREIEAKEAVDQGHKVTEKQTEKAAEKTNDITETYVEPNFAAIEKEPVTLQHIPNGKGHSMSYAQAAGATQALKDVVTGSATTLTKSELLVNQQGVPENTMNIETKTDDPLIETGAIAKAVEIITPGLPFIPTKESYRSESSPIRGSASTTTVGVSDTKVHEPEIASDSDSDSSDEVVLFQPKSRPASGISKPPLEVSKSNVPPSPRQTTGKIPQRPKSPDKAQFEVTEKVVSLPPGRGINVPKSATSASQSKSNGHPQPRSKAQYPAQTLKPSPQSRAPRKPTTSPAIIDPDDFNRAPIVRPFNRVAKTVDDTGGTGRPRRPSPRHGSPRRGGERGDVDRGVHERGILAPRTPESDVVDYVLKSGSPRGAARGKGKLWVP